VLPLIAVVLVLSAAGVAVVAFTARFAMKKLRLDVWDVLLWLGLAESPVDELTARRSVRLAVVEHVHGTGPG
jgi:hypothetical protein